MFRCPFPFIQIEQENQLASVDRKRKYLVTILKIMNEIICVVGLLLPHVTFVTAQVVCPDSVTYSPCDCTEYTGAQAFTFVTAKLDCSNRNLNDSKVNDILNAFISNPLVSPLNQLLLYGNQLTRVPQQIPQFHWLTFVNINNNQIPTVELAAFNFHTKKLNLIDLSDNQITNIKPNAFQGIFYLNILKELINCKNLKIYFKLWVQVFT